MDQQIRTCIISRNKDQNTNLVQIRVHPSWKIILCENWESWKKWRSIYLTKSKKTINEFSKRGIKFFSNFIKRKIEKDKYNELISKLEWVIILDLH